ncbi:C39 family peptidase [Marinicrinis lubricantis]|uniref:C39 family peptidase n=1 Tax=Marinicrinis lubricantis TaxID=2086470 RepID=A0ABW1IQK3_9BACL
MNILKIMKGFSLSMLVASLMFTSSVFTAILYASIQKDPSDPPLVTVQAGLTDAELNAADRQTSVPEPGGPVKEKALIDAPLIMQYPELPRGCEITTLTMLLNFNGIMKTKMEMEKELPRDNTPLVQDKDGNIISWGNPHVGFVGDITLKSKGFGVYNGPMFALLKKYIPTAVNLTGNDFSAVEASIAKGVPVMVWNTVHYSPPEDWVEWQSPSGKVRTTFKEHTVLVVGYDKQYVYINDPLKETKQLRVDKQQFIKGWEALGKQAITYAPS